MYHIAAASPKEKTAKQISDGWVELTLPGKHFIFSQCTICASVMTEPNSYLIRPETSIFVNQNGDGWTNESLKTNYESFIGAEGYVNHQQDPDMDVGFIADAALRRIILDKEENIFVYYVDILVATSKVAHPKLVSKILSKDIKFLSMGCESFISTCSACGHQASDETEFCIHLEQNKGKSFIDPRGTKRITAEMLGSTEDGSCEFQEASFLTEVPAFSGASLARILPIGPDLTVKIKMDKKFANKPAVLKYTESDKHK